MRTTTSQGRWVPIGLMVAALTGCAMSNTDSPVQTPGQAKASDTEMLEVGAQWLQDKPPIRALNMYLDGFHFYNGHPGAQMEAHHYCSALNEEVFQCVIYDGNTAEAKLMGVEYIISQRLFTQLPAKEKALWHSHAHEVSSGQLVAPGIPQVAETRLMEKLANTYGKTWHTWHTDRDKTLPIGIPALMMGFTADGQMDSRLLADRDRRFDVDSKKIRAQRADIVAHPAEPGANAWQQGEVIQLQRTHGGGEHSHGQTHFGPAEQLKQP